MRASRNKWPRACITRTLLAAVIVVVPDVASSQQSGQPLGPPIPLLPSSQPPAARPDPSASGRGDAVISEALAPASPGWVDGPTPPRDALPQAFWRGTTRAMADLLLTHLPDTPSPALQSLQRRLLLSRAAPPVGPDEGDYNLAMLRAAALLRLGELDAARAVILAIPERERGPTLPLAIAADAISGDIGRACATVRETVRRDQNALWQSALIACQALQGETEQASLGLQLLADEQGPRDEALTAAVETLAGLSSLAVVNRAERLDPLTLRLLVRARQSLSPSVIDTLRPDLALCLALDEEAPAGARLTAAERAARFGALPPERLSALYTAMAGGGEPGADSAFDRARRFVTIGQATAPAERLGRITGFVDGFDALQPGGFALAARLVLPALREIEPGPGFAAAAPIATRLLIAGGDTRAARRWSALTSGSEARFLRFLLALATGSDERPQAPPDPVLLALAAALGQPISPADWVQLPEAFWAAASAASPPSAAWLALTEAARTRRIGETVLATMMVAAPAGTISTDPVALYTAVSGLRQVGLEADARRLASEAALAAGL
jgi:hypothetical protein